jgi:hypothetical protein
VIADVGLVELLVVHALKHALHLLTELPWVENETKACIPVSENAGFIQGIFVRSCNRKDPRQEHHHLLQLRNITVIEYLLEH